MNEKPVSISKKPELEPAQDFYRLRGEGIGYVEQMGSKQWTDYNTHDPGITILEALCYAITDLAYRTGKDIKDILTPATPSGDLKQPYPNQSFFTARNILTINPWTPDDYRRILIDLDAVRNAWVFCKECGCDTEYFAWCEENKLSLSFKKPTKPNIDVIPVTPKGLYEVLLELESDPETGDLNDRKIEYSYNILDSDRKPHPIILELRFPEWGLDNEDNFQLFLNSNKAFNQTGEEWFKPKTKISKTGKILPILSEGESVKLNLKKLGATKDYNVFADHDLDTPAKKDKYLRGHWGNILYADFEIVLKPGNKKIAIENVALKVFGDNEAKIQSTVELLSGILSNTGVSGIIQLYRKKLKKVAGQVSLAKQLLNQHRNLDEDFCRIKCVGVEDVGVCADVEVSNEADIDKVQAQIWFEIEKYLNPPVPFYSLREMMDAGIPVEDIFNGPELENGFIRAADLANAGLKKVLRTSDIVNILMEIEGVVAVNNMLLGKFDDEGNMVKGSADPKWIDGLPDFDPAKTTASWLLYLKPQHLPRLYQNVSRFHFYKNGLPFNPRMDEVKDTLTQLRGEEERPKIKGQQDDLPVPAGRYSDIKDYFPIQYSLPLTYGIGTEGLPSHLSAIRKAQARQLKAYMMVYEQLLANAFAQIANASELFSLDPAVDRTYFVKEFSEELITGYNEITNGLTKKALENIAETPTGFQERRNRFLNHLLARFGEQFSEYALLLTNLQGKNIAADHLIEDKISFLNAYPKASQNRAKAFDYTSSVRNPKNISGLKKRVSLLLGFPDLSFQWSVLGESAGVFSLEFRLVNASGKSFLDGKIEVDASGLAAAEVKAFNIIIREMILPDAYKIKPAGIQYSLSLYNTDNICIGTCPIVFDSKDKATEMIEELTSWSSNERALVVEHLLLRPKFPGDALYPACNDGPCATCGDEDPYSFRLTYLMPGWTAPFNINLEMRRFADRTIRYEMPSHLLGKICWVGNDGFIQNPCDPLIAGLVGLLEGISFTKTGKRPTNKEACAYVLSVYSAFSTVFTEWYSDKTLVFIQPDALKKILEKEFSSIIPEQFACAVILETALWDEITNRLVLYFRDIALYGWQFERFEDAWFAWLKSNSDFDWANERLHEKVEAILAANLMPGKTAEEENLCGCASNILSKFGMAFYRWMESNFMEGRPLSKSPDFKPPKIALCSELSFKPGTRLRLGTFLLEKYQKYSQVSYQLWIVVNLLGNLRNTYPGATLHDCDDGSDQNPVRLGSTALGNYPLKRKIE